MKKFKVCTAALLLINASLCFADRAFSGNIIWMMVGATTTPIAYVQISPNPGGVCAFTGWRLLDLNDTFQKQAFSALKTAQNEGWSVTISYATDGTCKITSVGLLQKT